MMDAWLLQLATLSVTGFLCWVMLWRTIPEMNQRHEATIKVMIDECRLEKIDLRSTFTKEMKALREAEQIRRKRDSDRYHRLQDEIRQIRLADPGQGSGERKVS